MYGGGGGIGGGAGTNPICPGGYDGGVYGGGWGPTGIEVPGYGGTDPAVSISVVIEWTTQPPLIETYLAECTDKR